VLTSAPALVLVLAAAAGPVAEAERLAAAAKASPKAEASLADARRALVLTETFDPLRFVAMGRKGELVEDTYREALGRYRSHRAKLYEAMGECLTEQGQARAGVRYLRRAVLLDPSRPRVAALARALLGDDRAPEALDLAVRQPGSLDGELLAAAQKAADAAAVPSLQGELDRARLQKLPEPRPEPRDGPIVFGERLRLSTGAPFRLDEAGTTVVYVSDPGCRSCSSDIEALGKVVPEGVRVFVAPAVPDTDHPLRQALALYRRSWPVILGAREGAYGDAAPAVWVIGRGGWSAAVVRSPFVRVLPAVLEVFAQSDVPEARPRAAWNRRAPARRALPPHPSLLDDGLAPGEDEPAPPELAQAVTAFREKRTAEAARLFDALEARGDGWLLSPEARLNRALCVAAGGSHERARALLRGIGDSRFQERVDQALESLPRR
jgi:hypothetical protein